MIDWPPSPPGYTPRIVLQSPKSAEQKSVRMVVAVPSPAFIPLGFSITNISVIGSQVTLSWNPGTNSGGLFQPQSNSVAGWVNCASPTTGNTSTFTSRLPRAMFRVALVSQPILGRGGFNAPEKIVKLSDGRYAYPFSDGTYAKLALWTSYSDFESVLVPGFTAFRMPEMAVAGNRIVLTDTTIYGTNIISEFSISGDTLTVVTNFGIGFSSSGTCCQSVDGRVYAISFQPQTNGSTLFSSTMRSTNGTYSSSQILVPGRGDINEAQIFTCVGFHGQVWLFGAQDATASIALYKFGPNNTITYTNSSFLDWNSGNMQPSGEDPILTSVVDIINDRILLGYQGNESDLSCIGVGTVAGHSTITGVDNNNTPTSIGTTPWWSIHSDYPLVCMFPRGILIDTITENAVLDGCDRCQIDFQSSELTKGFGVPTKIIGGCNVDVAGSHPDGWYIYRDSNLFYRLGKL